MQMTQTLCKCNFCIWTDEQRNVQRWNQIKIVWREEEEEEEEEEEDESDAGSVCDGAELQTE